MLIYPDDPYYLARFYRLVREYIAYAKFAEQTEIKDHMKGSGTDAQAVFDKKINTWMKFLGSNQTLQREVREQGLIRDGDIVSFQLTLKPGNWLGCLKWGDQCDKTTCADKDNPMKRMRDPPFASICRGEIFTIKAIDDTDGFIRSCSRVGILYGVSASGAYYWVSMSCSFWFGCRTWNLQCPGKDTSLMKAGKCGAEVWYITAKDTPCGHTIQDRDVVLIQNGDRKALLHKKYGEPYFTIFKSDVGHDEFKKDLPCLTDLWAMNEFEAVLNSRLCALGGPHIWGRGNVVMM